MTSVRKKSIIALEMSRGSVLLCGAYISFLLLGGALFMNIEWKEQKEKVVTEMGQWTKIKDLLANSGNKSEWTANKDELKTLVIWLLVRCPHLPANTSTQLISPPGNLSRLEAEIERKCPSLHVVTTVTKYIYPWSYIDAVYFSMTVATTIGYGHIAPSTDLGRIICMIYALIGIPLTGILLAWTSSFFGERLYMLFRYKLTAEKQRSKFFIALGTVFYILVGFIVFIFVPAIIFSYMEDEWTYLEGVYYSFITLTTIGFGDLVSGRSKKLTGAWLYVYQLCVIIWILSGLGYWIMVANFITRALKSKKMHAFAKRATAVKKFIKEVSLVQNDPQFLLHSSKASMNFLLQLSSTLAVPELARSNLTPIGSLPSSAPGSPLTIPGIGALFGKTGMGAGSKSLFDYKSGFFSPIQKANENGTSSSNEVYSHKVNSSEENLIFTQNDKSRKSTDIEGNTCSIANELDPESLLCLKEIVRIASVILEQSDDEDEIGASVTNTTIIIDEDDQPIQMQVTK